MEFDPTTGTFSLFRVDNCDLQTINIDDLSGYMDVNNSQVLLQNNPNLNVDQAVTDTNTNTSGGFTGRSFNIGGSCPAVSPGVVTSEITNGLIPKGVSVTYN